MLLTLHQVLSPIEEDAVEIGIADVYTLPPGNNQNFDEDSGDKNCADGSINNLHSSQLKYSQRLLLQDTIVH